MSSKKIGFIPEKKEKKKCDNSCKRLLLKSQKKKKKKKKKKSIGFNLNSHLYEHGQILIPQAWLNQFLFLNYYSKTAYS